MYDDVVLKYPGLNAHPELLAEAVTYVVHSTHNEVRSDTLKGAAELLVRTFAEARRRKVSKRTLVKIQKNPQALLAAAAQETQTLAASVLAAVGQDVEGDCLVGPTRGEA